MKRGLFFLVSLFLLGTILLQSVSATDVAYIVSNPSNAIFNQTLQKLNMSYTIIRNSDILPGYDFSGYKMLLINDNYLSNWARIPVNDMPAVIVNSWHIGDWGWSVNSATLVSDPNGVFVDLNSSSVLNQGLSSPLKVYTSKSPDIYVLNRMEVYEGIESIAMASYDNRDIAIGLVRAGTNLTKESYPDTVVNDNSIYFGLYDTTFWSNETRTLFERSLLWVLRQETNQDFNLNLNSGINLISIPVQPYSNNVSDIFLGYSEINYIKEYKNEQIISALNINPHSGYFIDSSNPLSIILSGTKLEGTQTLNLKSGMNLVGFNILSNKSFDSLNIPDEVKEISKLNSDGSFIIATKYLGGWFNEFNLEPGKGYWVKSNSDVTWTYNP